jgi:two-component system, sensor histidine kinase and response regulator
VGAVHILRDITERKRAEEALRASEERYRGLVELSPDAVLINRNSCIAFANPAALQLFGASSAEQLVGKSTFEIFHSDHHAVIRQRAGRLLDGHAVPLIEEKIVRLDGSVVDVEAAASPFDDQDGRAIQVVLRDITLRKRAEEAARIEEKRLRSVLKITQHRAVVLRELLDGALDEATALSDSKLGYIYYYSEEKREFTLHAWSREAMAECRISNPPTVYQLDKTGLWGEAVRQRRPIVVNDFAAPNPLKRGYPPGHAALFRYLTLPVFSEGHVVAVVGVANKATDYTDLDVHQLTLLMESIWEIAERKQVEMALQKSEEKFSMAFHGSPAIMTIASLGDLRYVEVNKAFEQLTGYGRDEVAGRTASELDIWADREEVQRAVEAFAATGAFHNREHVFRTKTGQLRAGLLSAEVIEFAGQRCILTVTEDVTERRHAEEAVRRLAGRLLTAQEEERRRVAREMHDDLTQRLAVLAIEAGRLEQELASSGKDSGRLRSMKDQLIRLSTDVHALSRQLHPSILDDLGLADALRSECGSFSQREGIAVRCSLEEVPRGISRDVALCLYRVAQEGLRNIAKHAKAKEAIVSLAASDEGILLSIEDAGAGFVPGQVSGKPGLGLASMEERARLIGGDLSIRSEPGKGTLIEVWAPLSENCHEKTKNPAGG